MTTENDFIVVEDLLTKIKEAESLQAQLTRMLNHEDKFLRNAFALRWAVVADEVTILIRQAEAQFPDEQLMYLKQIINNNTYPACWDDYRDHSERLERLLQ